MKALIFTLVLVAACSAWLARLSGGSTNGERLAAEHGQEPAQILQLRDKPGRWVPFSATTTRGFNPGHVVVGKFYRAVDGSTRSETGPAVGEVNIVGIKNMSDKVFYLWNSTRGWEARPMELPPGGYFQPRPVPQAVTGPVDERIEGLDLIKRPTDRHGVTEYQAPQLNYFSLKMTIPCHDPQMTGCGLWLSDININQQPAELFKPPADASVVRRSEPGGIVRRKR